MFQLSDWGWRFSCKSTRFEPHSILHFNMEFPEDLKYTPDHEWLRIHDDNTATVGITAYATSELGDIVYLDVESVDETLAKEEAFGSIEAVKTVSDLFMPVDGTVLEFNEVLSDEPELVNADPYGAGWLIKIELTDPSQVESLLDVAAYREQIGQ